MLFSCFVLADNNPKWNTCCVSPLGSYLAFYLFSFFLFFFCVIIDAVDSVECWTDQLHLLSILSVSLSNSLDLTEYRVRLMLLMMMMTTRMTDETVRPTVRRARYPVTTVSIGDCSPIQAFKHYEILPKLKKCQFWKSYQLEIILDVQSSLLSN